MWRGGNWGAKVARKQNNKTGDCFESGKVQKSTFPSEVQKSSRSSGEVFWGDSRLLTVLDRLTSICLESWWQNER